MPDSNQKLCMILTPNMDSPDKKRGRTAQWTAQAMDAPIPIISPETSFINDLQR